MPPTPGSMSRHEQSALAAPDPGREARDEPADGRPIGLFSATCLVVASMIGTGVFTTSGYLLRSLQSPGRVLLVWLAGGVLAMLGALSYGALARQMPQSGGEYLFLSRTIHPSAGYVAGWLSLFVGFSAPAACAAFAFGQYVGLWWPGCSPKWSGTMLILLLTAIHTAHVKRGAFVQNGAVVLKVLVLLVFTGVTWKSGRISAPAWTGDVNVRRRADLGLFQLFGMERRGLHRQ
jgi:basic amino acid/polyamine antiporter, APA family